MSESVLIVGCGVMGLSSALHLGSSGRYNVTAIDVHTIPSPWSASNDINKIIRAEYADRKYTKMSVEAMIAWRNDKTFAGIYRECGRLLMTPLSHEGRRNFEARAIQCLKSVPGEGLQIERFVGGSELGRRFKPLKENSVADDAEIKWNPESGYAHSANALSAAYLKAKKNGVRFIFGESGHAVKIEERDGKNVVLAKDRTVYTADKIVISAGASTGYIINMQYQQSATALFVTHMKLTEEEYEKYKDIPVVFDSETGYFFPPDPDSHVLKLALSGLGGTNKILSRFNESELESLPRYKSDHPKDTMPSIGVARARNLMKKYIPELSGHELHNSKTCWIADTADSNFIIDKVPYLTNVFVASGDSGHAFKFLPTLGKYVMAVLENTLNEKFARDWKWKDTKKVFDVKDLKWRVVANYSDFSKIDWVEEKTSNYHL